MKPSLITEIYRYFAIFKKYAGSYLWLLLFIVLIGGFFESIGISMLMPLLDAANLADSSNNQITKIFYNIFNSLNVPFEFENIIFSIIIIFISKMIILIIQEYFKSNISANLQFQLRTKVVELFSRINYQFYTDNKIGFMNNLVTTEIARALSAFNNFINMLVALIYMLFYLLASCFINFQIAFSGGAIGAILFSSLKFISNYSRKFSRKISNKNALIQNLLIQLISSFQYLKSTNTFGRLLSKINIENKNFASLDFKTRMLSGILRALQETLSIIAVCGLMYFMVSVQGYPFNEILVISVLFQRTINKVGQFQGCWQKFNVHLGGIDTIDNAFKNFSSQVELNGEEKIESIDSVIHLNNISFKYENKDILKNVDLSIPANSMVAITGQSGSGKTTLINLITGLLKPTFGDIYINNINYKKIDLDSLRSRIGYVSQDSIIFNDSLYNNITLWSSNYIDDKKVKTVCESAYLFDEGGYFDAGLNTILGDKGVKLSGGQKQRVSIARELYRSPEILILDEATSSLDSKTEQIVQKSIDSLKGKLTIIIISHRLSTIKKCDMIYVIKNGKVCESGNFMDLNKIKGSEFSKMVSLQSLSK